MKKLLSLLLVSMLAIALTACGSTSTEEEGTTEGTTEETTEETTEDVTRIALILPYVGDQSYFDITHAGLQLVQEKYGDAVETNLIEMGTDAANWETANRQAVADGYDIIISGNFEYEAAMLAVAAENPDVKFLNFDYSNAEANSLDNVYAITYASNEIGYLAGVVAATKSETGVIGAVGGMEIDGIKEFLTGYMHGASDVNPDIQVLTGFVGDFANTGTAKEITLNMVDQGADVVFHAAGGAGNGMFEAAAEAGIWAIGVDTDQYVSLEEQPALAETILTSGLKRADQGILNAITAMIDGTAPYGTQVTLTLSDDGVGLAENEHYLANMTEEQIATVNEFSDKVYNKETEVASQLKDNTAFDTYSELTK